MANEDKVLDQGKTGDGHMVNRSDRLEELLGLKGMEIILNTATHTPATGFCFVALQALADTVIAAATADATAPITGTIAALALPAGVTIYGKFLSITLTSGKAIAYVGAI